MKRGEKTIPINLALDEALEYLKLIGSTSAYEREKFFQKKGIKPRQDEEDGYDPDIFSVIYDQIQEYFKVKLGHYCFVSRKAWLVDDYFVILDEKLVKGFEKERVKEVWVVEGE